MLTLVTGYSKSGKSSLVKLLNDKMPWNYAIYSKRPLHSQGITMVHEVKITRSESDLEKYIQEKRKVEPYYFIRNCYNKSINGNEYYNLMVTDFRFPEEYEFLRGKGRDPMTIRIFRKEAVPKHEWEHALDNFQTEILLIPLNSHEHDFTLAKEIFPQYADYTQHKRTFFYI